MATVYKRSRDKNKRGAKYTCQYLDEFGKRKTVAGFTDKGESQRLADKLEQEAQRVKHGLSDRVSITIAKQKSRPITEHLEDFRVSLARNPEITENYIKQVTGRIERSLATFKTLNDIAVAEDIRTALSDLRNKLGFGAKTFNHYRSSIGTFGNWLVKNKRALSNPFTGIDSMNTAIDVRKKRRALSGGEFLRLVRSAKGSPKSIQCYTGPERAMIYQIAGYSGLRRAEIGSLTPESFDFKAGLMTIEATIAKNRRKDVLPIHPKLKKVLQPFVKNYTAGEVLFPKLAIRKTYWMIEQDLEAVGIPYKTADGTADFHAVRHTYITHLMNAGATVLDVKALARHSEVSMTMKYSHADQTRKAEAMAKLSYQSDSEAANGCNMAASECHNGASDGNLTPQAENQNTKKPHQNTGFDGVCQSLSSVDIVEPKGVEPSTSCMPCKRSPS